MKKVTIVGLIVAVLIASLVASCAPAEEGAPTPTSVTIVDRIEREVTVPAKVERVVSMMKECTTTVLTLGAGDKLVGIDTSSEQYFIYQKSYLEKNPIQVVGSAKEPNIEQIVTLKPDVILSWGGYGAQLADELQEQTGIPVVCLHTLTTIEGMREGYRIVGKMLGMEERAEELLSYADSKIAQLTKVTSGIPESEKPKVHLLFWSFWNGVTRIPIYYDPVDIAGGINIAKGQEATVYGYSVKVPVEQVVVWNPDIILIHGAPKTAKVRVETILQDPRLKDTSAIKNSKVFYTLSMSSGWHYPRVLTETMYMAKRFHPDKFADLDPEKEGNEIYEKFYGVSGLWTAYGREEGYIE